MPACVWNAFLCCPPMSSTQLPLQTWHNYYSFAQKLDWIMVLDSTLIVCVYIYVYLKISVSLFFHFFLYLCGLMFKPCNRKSSVHLFLSLLVFQNLFSDLLLKKNLWRTLEVKSSVASTAKILAYQYDTGHKLAGHQARTTHREENAWGDTNKTTALTACWGMLQTVKCIYCLWSQHSHISKRTCYPRLWGTCNNTAIENF